MNASRVDIIIVNWKAGPLLARCLESIRQTAAAAALVERVIVVNNSPEESIAQVATSEIRLHTIQNSTNIGFAAACNRGAAIAKAPYLLFLNPDTQLHPRALQQVVAWMDNPLNSKTAVCGIQLVDERGQVTASCRRFPSARDLVIQAVGLDRILPQYFAGQFMTPQEHMVSGYVDQIIGAFFFVRRNVFADLGGFDERFFVYFEELDFSVRLAAARWNSYYLASVRSYHKGQGSSTAVKAERLFYSWRSRLLYSFKHFGRAESVAVLLVTLTCEPLVRTLVSALHGAWQQAYDTCAATVYLWRAMPSILRFVIDGRRSAAIVEE